MRWLPDRETGEPVYKLMIGTGLLLAFWAWVLGNDLWIVALCASFALIGTAAWITTACKSRGQTE